MKKKINSRNFFPLIGFPLFFLGIFSILIIFYKPLYQIFNNPEGLKNWVNSFGILAPLIFIGLQILQVIIFVIPGEVPQVGGGYLFGIGWGTIYSVFGIAVGSSINFLLARLLGVPFVRRIFKQEQLARIEDLASTNRSRTVIFTLFLIPGLPFKDILTYVVGLSPMKFFTFLLISMLGRLPGIIGSAIMGDAAANRNWLLALTIMSVATVLFLAGYLLKDKILAFIKQKVHHPQAPADGKEMDKNEDAGNANY